MFQVQPDDTTLLECRCQCYCSRRKFVWTATIAPVSNPCQLRVWVSVVVANIRHASDGRNLATVCPPRHCSLLIRILGPQSTVAADYVYTPGRGFTVRLYSHTPPSCPLSPPSTSPQHSTSTLTSTPTTNLISAKRLICPLLFPLSLTTINFPLCHSLLSVLIVSSCTNLDTWNQTILLPIPDLLWSFLCQF